MYVRRESLPATQTRHFTVSAFIYICIYTMGWVCFFSALEQFSARKHRVL